MTPGVLDETAIRRNEARQRRRRILVPIGVVLLVLIAILSIALVSYRANRADALALSEDVIQSLQQRIETEVEAYLAPVSKLALMTRDLLSDTRIEGIRREVGEPLALQILSNNPQITILSVGTTNGDFFMVRRETRTDPPGYMTKRIEREIDPPRMTLIHRDGGLQEIDREQPPWDEYDPRTRPWYQGADELRGLFWTDVYVFFTDRTPGVTVSVPFLDQGGDLLGVLGLDVTLNSLSRFLGTLEIGKTGKAIIVDQAGRLIAHPESGQTLRDTGDALELMQVEGLRDPVVSRAFDRFRVEGYGRQIFTVDGRRYISAANSLRHLLQRDWSVLIIVPEDDFVGFVRENLQNSLAMLLSVIALASVLAGLLVRQGLRADRNASLVLSRQADLERQGEAFATLATQAALFESGDQTALALLTEKTCEATGVRRTSVWEFGDRQRQLMCIDSYDHDLGGHTEGTCLRQNEHAELFETLLGTAGFSTNDAARDPRSEVLHRVYLDPLGCEALLSTPIQSHDRVVGALWLESGQDRVEWDAHVRAFAQAVANLLALRYSALGLETPGQHTAGTAEDRPPVLDLAQEVNQERTQTGRSKPTDSDASLGTRRAAAFVERLAARAGERGTASAQVIDGLSVMALRFTDETALAMDTAENRSAVDLLIGELEHLATENGLTYLKFMSDQVIAAAGIDTDPAQGASQIAGFALAVQQLCNRLFATRHSQLTFRVGLDHGPVIGSVIGPDQRSYNLWGEAIRMAGTMADTSLPGSVQATESVYRLLRSQYLFQVRGTHYLDGVGEFKTYIMSGRL